MMIRTALLIPLIAVLLSCGLFTPSQRDEPAPRVVDSPTLPPATHGEPTPRVVDSPSPPPAAHGEPTPGVVHAVTAPVVTGDRIVTIPLGGDAPVVTAGDYVESPLAGDTSIEEKIIRNNVAVRATMTSVTSEVLLITDNRYRTVLKFNLSVSEYLMGSGPTSIVAVWVDSRSGSYETSSEANARKAVILARRDAQWDDRDAIIFLHDGASGYGTLLDEQLQRADHFILALGGRHRDDRYSLHSESSREWLPAVAPPAGIGDAKEFLLDVPPTSKTITLNMLKKRIREVTAEYSGGDGSEAYKDCVVGKYEWLRNQRNWPEERGNPYGVWDFDYKIVSGLAAGTVLDQVEAYGVYPDNKITSQLAGSDSSLFSTGTGASTSIDRDKDGVFDQIKYDQMVKLARPLPAGEYSFELQESWPGFAICNFVVSDEVTVTVTAPASVLHELLFDPVTVGSAVAADDTNGVLKPASFTVADGSSATIERISYEPPSSDSGQAGTVKLAITAGSDPDDLLGEHLLDFIELDGTVSLSLYVAAATVDTANDTLSWTASSQPWEDGDKLMVRIRRAPPSCSSGAAVPNPRSNAGLVADCKTLLALKNTLAGTASLNWSVESAMSTWDGVSLGGTPRRVTRLMLDQERFDGNYP